MSRVALVLFLEPFLLLLHYMRLCSLSHTINPVELKCNKPDRQALIELSCSFINIRDLYYVFKD